jgi:hypothetical protein
MERPVGVFRIVKVFGVALVSLRMFLIRQQWLKLSILMENRLRCPKMLVDL